MNSLYEKLEQALNLSAIMGLKIHEDGTVETIGIFTDSPRELFDRDELDSWDPRLYTAFRYMREKGLSPHQVLSSIQGLTELWVKDPSFLRVDTRSEHLFTWNYLLETSEGLAMLNSTYWPGQIINNTPVVHEQSKIVRETGSWSEFDKRFPGIEKHYKISAGLGLNAYETASYCFEQVFMPQHSSLSTALPEHGFDI